MHGHARFTALVFMFPLASAFAGCSDQDRLVLGRERDADPGRPEQTDRSPMFGNAGGQPASPPVESGSSGVEVWIEHERAVADVVSVCPGECVEVEAAARGGFPPYSFAWEDGSTGAKRRLCPDETAEFTVAVTDSGQATGEFKQSPRTATSSITAQVQACPDGGGVGGGAAPMLDAGADAAIREDSGTPDAGDPTLSACALAADRVASCVELPFSACSATIGSLYTTELPQPIEPGESPCIWLDIADPQGGVLPLGGVELSTGNSSCIKETTLGGYLTPFGSLVFESNIGMCPAPVAPIGWLMLDLSLGFAGNPQLIRARLCDVCPIDSP